MTEPAPPSVCVVGRFPPPLDGQSIATRRLATLLDGRRSVETFDLSPGEEAFVRSRATLHPGRALHYLRTSRELRRWLRARAQSPVLWASVSASTLGHFRDMSLVAPAFGREQRVFAVVHHGGFAELFRRRATRRSAQRLVRQLSGVVFLSETLADRASQWIPAAKRLVVPNTIDDALIPTEDELDAKRRRRESGGALRILFFSNMIPAKGYLDVVRALGILRQRGVDAHADFVGRWGSEDGPAAFEATVCEAGVAEHVTHHGGVSSREAARAHYLAADVFCLPTTYPTEAQPLTVIEALAAGCPAVVTPHASLPEMVEAGCSGEFARPHDPLDLADAIRRAADGGTARISDARARFERAFSPDAVRRQWLTLLDRSRSGNAPSA